MRVARLVIAVVFSLLVSAMSAPAQQVCGTVGTCPPASTPLSGAELIFCSQGGVTKKCTASQLSTAAPGVFGTAPSVISDAVCWNNIQGTSIKDCGIPIGIGADAAATQSLAIGQGALASNTADNCLAIGWHSLNAFTTSQGTQGVPCGNVAIGQQTLYLDVTGGENTAVGQFAAANVTAGADTAVGQGAMQQATTAAQSVALGWGALYGLGATCTNTGCTNGVTGSFNTALGYYTLANMTTGSGNVAVGQDALFTLTSGGGNVALGYTAGQNLPATTNYTVIIGNCPGDSFVTKIIYLCDGFGDLDVSFSQSQIILPATNDITFNSGNSTGYALYGDTGLTRVNVPSGGTVSFAVNNNPIAAVTSNVTAVSNSGWFSMGPGSFISFNAALQSYAIEGDSGNTTINVPAGGLISFKNGGQALGEITNSALFQLVPNGVVTLPACNSGTSGSLAIVNNGVNSPTYHQAVGSSTGSGVWPVWCTNNGSSYAWVY